MDSTSDLRLFLREPRSLAHRAHQGKSRLRSLAASVILDLGFPHRDIRVYADVTQTDLTETLDIPVYTYGRNKAR